MTISTGLCRAAANTSPGSQVFLDPNMTVTPNGARFIISRAVTDGTAAAHATLGYGAATSTTARWCCGIQVDDAAGTTNANRIFMNDQCICILNTTGSAVEGEADFVQFIPNTGSGAGVEVTWGDAPAGAYFVTVELYAMNAIACGTYVTGASAGATTTVTPGFPSTLILAATTGSATLDTLAIHGTMSAGACAGNLSQFMVATIDRNTQAATQVSLQARNDRIVSDISTTGVENWGSEITSITATTFVATQRIANGGGDLVGYLAMDTGSIATWVGTFSSPTSTGNQSITAPNFIPQFVGLGLSGAEALATAYNNASAGIFGSGAFTPTAEFSTTIADEDAATTSNAQSLSDNVAVNLPDHTGAALCVANFVSMDATGWTLNHTAVSATAKIWGAFAIQAEAAGVTFAPAAVSAVAATVAPTVVLGSVSITPAEASAVAAATAPTVALGSLAVAPDPATAVVATIDPSVIAGSLLIAPSAVSTVASTVDPTVILGGLAIAPNSASAVVTTVNPTVIAGSLVIVPDSAVSVVSTVSPSVAFSSLVITPSAITAVVSVFGPTVVAGSGVLYEDVILYVPAGAIVLYVPAGEIIVYG